MISRPAVIVNFKAYLEVDGLHAMEMAKLCESISSESGVRISICPPMTELGAIARSVDIPVLSQNADPHSPGSHTGWITPSMIKASGAVGTLINHAEHKQSLQLVEETMVLSKASELMTVICADNVRSAVKLASFSPDFIAVEPPELIGGDMSVTTANPSVVESAVESVRAVNKHVSLLCGAGVKTGADVKKALELGADGVLIASGVIKSKDPRASLLDLVRYL